jgi:hypothetical protein
MEIRKTLKEINDRLGVIMDNEVNQEVLEGLIFELSCLKKSVDKVFDQVGK